MPVIDHRRFGQKRPPVRSRWRRRALYIAGGLLGAFVLANGAVAMWFSGKVLPNYTLGGQPVGGMSYETLSRDLTTDTLLPSTLTLRKDGHRKGFSSAVLGIRADAPASLQALKRARTPLPLLSLVTRHHVAVVTSLDEPQFDKTLAEVRQTFARTPLPNHIIFDGTGFAEQAPSDGYAVDKAALEQDVRTAAAKGQTVVTVPTAVVRAPAPSDLSTELARLQRQLRVKISFMSSGKTVQASAREIGTWFARDGQTMRPAAEPIIQYMQGVSPEPANQTDLVHAIGYALQKEQAHTFAVVPKDAPVWKYCVAVRGVADSALGDLRGKLAATYADTRGWNAGGRIAFQYVESGCDYVVWLAAPSQMATFGDICDSYYSCQVGANVIINDDRWNTATAPWNATGAPVEDYRTLVINHETGHRLGFYDNNVCPAAGGLAPVMMQQSIDLHGCAFNRWPTEAELHTYLAEIGL